MTNPLTPEQLQAIRARLERLKANHPPLRFTELLEEDTPNLLDEVERLQKQANSQPALLAACEAGLSEMLLWKDEGCCCPPEGHKCGIQRLNANIKKAEAAIEATKEE